jgi:maleylacetoacetate isomerase
MKLYHYWRSSASYRVRIALNFKNMSCQLIHVNILDGSNETPEHLARHPLGYVPVLEVNGKSLMESVAIIEWIEEMTPSPALYPVDSYQKALVRALVEIINAGTQPLQNVPVFEYYSSDPEKQKQWAHHFALRGLQAYEKAIQNSACDFSIGNTFLVPDVFLVPQCYSALRFGVDLEKQCPVIWRIYQNSLKLPFVERAHPDHFKM